MPQLGPHERFFDLCCGGASLLLAKPPAKVEVVNDKHEGLINFLRVMASSRWRILDEKLSNTANSEAMFMEAAEFVKANGWLCTPDSMYVDMLHVQAAYYTYILWWMGQGGMAGSAAADERPRFSIRYTDGGRVGTRFRKATQNLQAIRDRIERVEFWNQDLFKVLGKIEDRAGTVIYADPPWLDDGDAYRHSFDQARDQDETLLGSVDREPDDYDRFAEAVHRFKKARVIIRIGSHVRLQGLFTTGWHRISIDRTNHLSSQGRRSQTAGDKKAEVLLLNQDPIPEEPE